MKKLSGLFLLIILVWACQEDQQLAKKGTFADSQTSAASVNCTEGDSTDIEFNGSVVGEVSVSDASSDLEIEIDLTGSEYFLMSDSAWAGSCEAPELAHGEVHLMDDEVRMHTFSIDLANLPECGCVYVTLHIGRWDAQQTALVQYLWEQKIEYCKCPDKNLRTQTQGGWGAEPEGENPGAYLHANFDAAFPDGLVVGCDYTVTLTSAQAVTDFLPSTGTPEALTQSYTDPGGTLANTLAGQVVALKLSVTFDLQDEDFGEADSHLEDAVITSGTFEGWTVGEVLAEAERVLGGCESIYTASEISDVVAQINESFVDGTTDTGFLDVQ
jgi:hypothetical protein